MSARPEAHADRESASEHAPSPDAVGNDDVAVAPAMLTLIDLDQQQIDSIAETVPGGAENIQDIYPLSPLQEAMLFQHLLNEQSDTYVLSGLFELRSHSHVVGLINGLQRVIARHDALRSAILWEKLPRPVQVVYRKAALSVEQVALERDRDPVDQLKQRMRMRSRQLDLRQAPLLRLQVAMDPDGERWYALIQRHHIVFDHQSWNVAFAEAMSCMVGQERGLPPPQSYRRYVAWSMGDTGRRDAEVFFRQKLGDVEEPTAPFGLLDVSVDGTQLEEAHELLYPDLAQRIRSQAAALGTSAARLFHAAWALVVVHTSSRSDVVLGTVLMGSKRSRAQVERMIGLFVNTLPLRLSLKDVTARELVERTDQALRELLNHQHVSPALAQSCSGSKGKAPLFTAVLNYRHSAGHSVLDTKDGSADAAGIRVVAQQYRTNFPIMLVVDDLGDRFTLVAQTDRRIDPHRVIGYVTTAMRSLLDALERAPQTLALSLPILPEDERQLIVELFNATKVARSPDRLIHELFEEQVQRTPGATAAVYEGQSITYAELNRQANRLARYLVDHGVRPDQPVGICAERGVEMVIGVVGILKAGGAYVPLDPNYPTERLQYMLDDANPRIVLTQEKLRGTLPETQAEVVALDALLPRLADDQGENLPAAEVGLRPQNLVYVIYTSGTTGRPKGTAMAHHSMVNLIEWHREHLPVHEGQRVLQFAALSFDVAFQEIFTTLCLGGTLVLLDEWVRRDARALMQLLSDQAIERMFLPPLMLQSLAEHFKVGEVPAPGGLRDVITAGEQLRISPEIASFFRHLNGCRLHNHYGPTETHVVTALTLAGHPDEWPALPTVGRPIANTQIYVLDGQRQPVPLGVVGEIYIGGANVARGYLNRTELTEQRFVADPFSGDARACLYKTGDLGRWRADGVLEYLGRNDDQVKIRGFRIELGEIEAQLALHPQVKEAAVIAREDVPGEKRLVAYVTPRDHVTPSEQVTPSAEELRNHLQAVLPEHMIPSAFVALQSLPLTPSGKLNRRALPAPDLDAYVSRHYEAPQGESEQILARIWQELLRVERVGRHDNFFELGGHSLLVLRLSVRIVEECGLHLNLQAVFQNPTIQELGLLMEGTQPGNQPTSDQTQFEEIII